MNDLHLKHALSDYGLVYIATPYSKYPPGIERAFIEAAALTADLLRAGVKAYSPIAHTHPIAIHGSVDPYDHDIWMPFDEAIMAKSDALAVTLMDTWDESRGIAHEIDYFEAHGKPVFLLDPETLGVQRLGKWEKLR